MTLQIPNDLYPNSQFLEKASIIAEYYMHIATIFGKYFSSEEEIISYLQSFKNHEDAEHFLETGNTLFLNRKLDDPSLQMVMIISAVEKNTQKGFSDFNSWVNSSGSTFDSTFSSIYNAEKDPKVVLKEIIVNLSENYNQKHGARNNFADFIEKYVSGENQFRLILGFHFVFEQAVANYSSRIRTDFDPETIDELATRGFEIRRAFLPKCYNWKKCFATTANCNPDIGCLLNEDPSFKKQTIRSISKMIYDMRSHIVHKAAAIPFVRDMGPGVSSFNYVMLAEKMIFVNLKINQFEQIIVDALKNYFDWLHQ